MKLAAVITGAAGGIGAATALAFHEAGWETFAVDRQPLLDLPEDIHTWQADISIPEEVEGIFKWIATHTSALHALVNNAAVQICKPLIEMSVEEWDMVQASNLRSIFLTCRDGHSLLKAGHGAIVNVSSVHAVATSVDIAAYAASKGAIVALTRAMAVEFAEDGIRVNAILPGAVDTPMLHSGLSRGHVGGDSVQARMDDLGRRTVMGRVGRPSEIAQGILFLADSQRSSFMTGTTMLMDGGATARLSTE